MTNGSAEYILPCSAHESRIKRCNLRERMASVQKWSKCGSLASGNTAGSVTAHLRSHSGPESTEVFLGCPTCFEFRMLVLERLRLPLQVSRVACVCGARLDTRGWHREACPRSGLVRTRHLHDYVAKLVRVFDTARSSKT